MSAGPATSPTGETKIILTQHFTGREFHTTIVDPKGVRTAEFVVETEEGAAAFYALLFDDWTFDAVGPDGQVMIGTWKYDV